MAKTEAIKELSISRWHTVVRRLNEEKNQKQERLENMSSTKQVGLIKGMTIEPGPTIEDISKLIADIEDITIFVCAIKTAINKANADVGISAHLVDADGISSMMRVLDDTISRAEQEVNAMTYKQVKDVLLNMTTDKESVMVRVVVKPLNQADLDKLQEIADSYKIRRDKLMDDVSDLNKQMIALNVPAAFGKFV